MSLPRVFIPQIIERWDEYAERFTRHSTAGRRVLRYAHLVSRQEKMFRCSLPVSPAGIMARLPPTSNEDFFVAVGDPSVIAICAGLILRRNNNLRLLKWDKKLARYIALDINV